MSMWPAMAVMAVAAGANAGPMDGGVARTDAGLARGDAGADRGRSLRLPDGGVPPRGLACLPTWYAGTVSFRPDGGWGLELADGIWVPWERPAAGQPELDTGLDGGIDEEDGNQSAAALIDLYRVPYHAGPIRPVDASDAGTLEDPGRIRVEELLKATYGHDRPEVASQMGRVRFFGTRYAFHRRAVPALNRTVERLTVELKKNPRLRPFLAPIGGTWSWRHIARSKNLSTHAWGIAIDLNADRAHYWRWTRRGEPLVWRNRVPQAIVDSFEAEGFIWGGRWQHFDTMHFEYRPELLSDNCQDRPVAR
jgi:hypothetical protein